MDFPPDASVIGQVECIAGAQKDCDAFLRTISSMRFLDLDAESLRRPSIPGQTTLGDKGENLASVLQAICKNPASKEALIAWTRELTPLDVTDLKFPEVSLDGKIQLQLVEQGGGEISAESASDGTLRFLAVAGAMLGTDPARLYFFEEIGERHPSQPGASAGQPSAGINPQGRDSGRRNDPLPGLAQLSGRRGAQGHLTRLPGGIGLQNPEFRRHPGPFPITT